tara:strand:- start:57 stop:569 length:513 start_codon:yes stop_codon:yes gene_type:complete
MRKYLLLTLFLSLGFSQNRIDDIQRMVEDVSETIQHTEIYPDGTLKSVHTYKMLLSKYEWNKKKQKRSPRYFFGSQAGTKEPREYILVYITEYNKNGDLSSFTEGYSYWTIKKDNYEKTFYSKDEENDLFRTKVEKYKDGKKDGEWKDYLKNKGYLYEDGRLKEEWTLPQ